MDKKIAKFIHRHHVMTLATTDDHAAPWCSNLFYAYSESTQELIFTSSESTAHAKQFVTNNIVAASILLESRTIGKLQGLQLCGVVREGTSVDRDIFLRMFPYAIFSLKEIWAMSITYAKYTDNTLGFGTKLIYEK